MSEPDHYHQCPRCSRVWSLAKFMQLPDLGLRRIFSRVDGQVRVTRQRERRCTCDQRIEQSAALGAPA